MNLRNTKTTLLAKYLLSKSRLKPGTAFGDVFLNGSSVNCLAENQASQDKLRELIVSSREESENDLGGVGGLR